MTLERHVCFGVDEQEYYQKEFQEYIWKITEQLDQMKEEEIKNLLLAAVDRLILKENPNWSDYRFLASIKEKIDAHLG